MSSILRDLYAILDRGERAKGLVVLLLMLVAAAADMLGVAIIMPFVQLAMNPDRIGDVPTLDAMRDILSPDSTIRFVIYVGLSVLLVLISSLALRAVSLWVQVRYGAQRRHAIASRLLARYLSQPYEWYLQRHSSEISTSVLAEADQAVQGSLFPLMQIVANGLVVLFLAALLLAIDPWMAMGAAILLGGGYFLVFLVLQGLNSRIGVLRQKSNRERYRVVQEAFGGFKDVKLLGLEATFSQRFLRPSTDMAFSEANSRTLSELPRFAMQGIVFMAMILAVLYVLTTKGKLDESLPALAGFAFAGFRLLPALQTVYADATKLRFGAPVLRAVVAELNRSPDAEATTSPPEAKVGAKTETGLRLPSEKSIRLDNIRYAYPGTAAPALDAVKLEIRARSTVGIVGTTGSGKTTLVDVMLGLLEPAAGRIIVDGTPITRENRAAWQRSLGYVPQQIYLADDSVAGNIAFGVPHKDIDLDAVERAARAANLHDFVVQRLPKGYDTEVGERGVRLSGGQRQRIGIARALYRDPAVLMLDEATSALDNVTEQAVMDAIDQLEGEKTIVLIAHRLSTVRRCERIFLMEMGRCIDAGSWDELIARNKDFREMTELSA